MKQPSRADAFEVLVLQAADEGRGPILFGDSQNRARKALRPFMVGKSCPSIYLEFPLIGEPFLDVTVLYSELEPGTRIASAATAGTEGMLDWFASVCAENKGICCGFELDTKNEDLPAAAVHFQPRARTHLVEPFCKAVGEPERAALYLDLASRMPTGWPLSFFGMFRGRSGSPLRVCGYLNSDTQRACAHEPQLLATVFDEIGFSAYDENMLAQISALLAAAPGTTDFQFDVYPDGTLGDTFAIDIQFGVEQPEAVRVTFEDGPGARLMNLLEGWGAADGRWRLGAQAAFARAISVELDGGEVGRYAFSLLPQWAKARWTNCALQPSKLYLSASADLLK